MRIFWPCLVAALLHGGIVSAQSSSAVKVLLHGGVQEVRVLDRLGVEVFDLGTEPISPGVLIASNDVKVVTNTGYLLAQSNGQGFSYWNQGSQEFLLDPAQRYRRVSSASIAGTDSLGNPSRVLFSDAYSNTVVIREVQGGQNSWFRSLALLGGVFGEVEDAILLPTGEVAVATNYAVQGLSTVDVFALVGSSHYQFTNREHNDGPPGEMRVIPDLTAVRDLVGQIDGTLLIGSAYEILRVTAEGQVLWRFDLASRLGGELISLMTLPDQTIAVAMHQPGEWIQPHTNHRVVWIDEGTAEVIATSGPLDRAPVALDRYLGHGATGTPGFSGGAEFGEGTQEDILLAGLATERPLYSSGDDVELRLNAINTGTLPVTTESIRIEVAPGRCLDATNFERTFARLDAAILYPGATIRLEEAEDVSRFDAGFWCVQGRVVFAEGEKLSGTKVEFEVRRSGGSNVDVEDLPFSQTPDFGLVDADMGGMEPIANSGEGCGCDSGGGAVVVFTLLVPGLIRRRRRS